MAKLTKKSPAVDFYREAIDQLMIQMAGEFDEDKIDMLHGNIIRLTNQMADAAFNEIVNRTENLLKLQVNLQRIIEKAGGPTVGQWVSKLKDISDLIDKIKEEDG